MLDGATRQEVERIVEDRFRFAYTTVKNVHSSYSALRRDNIDLYFTLIGFRDDQADLNERLIDGLHEVRTQVRGLSVELSAHVAETAHRFAGVDRRLDGVDRRLDGVEGRLGGVESRLEGVEGRLEGVEGRLEGVEGRLEGVDRRLDGVEGRLGGVEGRLEGVEGQLHGLHELVVEVRSLLGGDPPDG